MIICVICVLNFRFGRKHKSKIVNQKIVNRNFFCTFAPEMSKKQDRCVLYIKKIEGNK
jgi:hypothetical protein